MTASGAQRRARNAACGVTTPFVYADGGGSGCGSRPGHPSNPRSTFVASSFDVYPAGSMPIASTPYVGIATFRDVGRREAPVAVLRGHEPVMDLGRDRERMVDRPAARRPLLLGHEQRRHQRLEHAAAPPRHDAEVFVPVGALEHLDAEVPGVEADRLRLRPAPVAGVGECPPGTEVLLRRQLALGDPDVARDPAFADDRVVAARRIAVLRRVSGMRSG